jgi:hypothetical protein
MFSIHRLEEREAYRRQGDKVAPVYSSARSLLGNPGCQWAFTQADLDLFPALRYRNFWCVQRHQARGERGDNSP